MRRHHHPVAGLLAHAEHGFQHHSHELTWRIVVIQQNDLIELRPLQLWLDLRFWFEIDRTVAHHGRSCLPFIAVAHGKTPLMTKDPSLDPLILRRNHAIGKSVRNPRL